PNSRSGAILTKNAAHKPNRGRREGEGRRGEGKKNAPVGEDRGKPAREETGDSGFDTGAGHSARHVCRDRRVVEPDGRSARGRRNEKGAPERLFVGPAFV